MFEETFRIAGFETTPTKTQLNNQAPHHRMTADLRKQGHSVTRNLLTVLSCNLFCNNTYINLIWHAFNIHYSKEKLNKIRIKEQYVMLICPRI